jgi:hypothetical protein
MTDTASQPAAPIITCPTCGRANRVPAAARGMPTLLVLDHGRPLARQVGALPGNQLERWIEGALAECTAGRP